jgi:mannosyl-glycoprotein endo-beta-N-acetylglucosaminidase
MEPFSIESDLKTRPSPLTTAGIDKWLKTMASGLNGIGAAVMAASAKYGINATYILAHAIHETDWGQSKILKAKNNLFGFGAFDDTPFESAKAFPSQAVCVDFVMGQVNAKYLSPTGVHFRQKPVLGNKQYGMNVKYATDPHWGESIARIARQLEKEIK